MCNHEGKNCWYSCDCDCMNCLGEDSDELEEDDFPMVLEYESDGGYYGEW